MGRQEQFQVLKGVVRQTLLRRFHTSPISSHPHRERPSVSGVVAVVESEKGVRVLSDSLFSKSSTLFTAAPRDHSNSLNPKSSWTELNKCISSSLGHNASSKVDGCLSTEVAHSSAPPLSDVVPLLYPPHFPPPRNSLAESYWASALTCWPISIRNSRTLAGRMLSWSMGSPAGGGGGGGGGGEGGVSRGFASLVGNSNNVEKVDEVVAHEGGASREGQGGDDGVSASVSGREIAVVKKRRKRKSLIQEVEMAQSERSAEDSARRALSDLKEEGKTLVVNPASPADDNVVVKPLRAVRRKRSKETAHEKILRAFNENGEVLPETITSHPSKSTNASALEATEKKPLGTLAFSNPPNLAEGRSSVSSAANGSAQRDASSHEEKEIPAVSKPPKLADGRSSVSSAANGSAKQNLSRHEKTELPAFSKPSKRAEGRSSVSSTPNGAAERYLSRHKDSKSTGHLGLGHGKDIVRLDGPTGVGMMLKENQASSRSVVLAETGEEGLRNDISSSTVGKTIVGLDSSNDVRMATRENQVSSLSAALAEPVEEVPRKNTLNSTVVQVPSVSAALSKDQITSVESNGSKSGNDPASGMVTNLAVCSSSEADLEVDGAEFSNPQELYLTLVESKGGRPYQNGEKARLNSIFYRFTVSGWVSDQALSLYINSKFFPSAASRFRRFFLHKSSPELRSYVASLGSTNEAPQFLFPLFAEFCIHEFPNEINRYRELVNTADMTKPDAWYPFARAMKRKVVYHKGPTNSGKTYNALKRFMEASSGIYCSPLRLLAMEVFDTVNMQGVYCNLHTGQEKKDVPFSNHLACTVEMCYLTRQWEVAVIDEIQMMNDEYRGWAWTRAFLGLQADEIHVCGDPSALPLIRNLCNGTGDDLVEYEYERFMPLKVAEESLRGDFRNIEAGDCIVAFSRRDIFDIKREVELASKHRCCVVYGALPPETRTQQAKLFNELGNDYNVLVASDAIGMGLNLNIRRVVFFCLDKFDGDSKKPVPPAQVKQIAGRAGRRGSLYPEGVTTTFFSQDLPYLTSSMQQAFEPAAAAGLFPVFEQVELFASQLPNENFAKLLERFSETCKLDGAFFLCRYDNLKRVANMLEKVKGLSLEDRFNFCFAPVNVRDPQSMGALYRYATAFSQKIPVHVEMGVPSSSARDEFELLDLEARHQVLSMYLWLSQHFPGDLFPQKEQAGEMASQIAVLLGQSLVQSSRRWTKRKLNQQQHRGRPNFNMGWSDNRQGDSWRTGRPKLVENFVQA